jgi:hypothetical protein
VLIDGHEDAPPGSRRSRPPSRRARPGMSLRLVAAHRPGRAGWGGVARQRRSLGGRRVPGRLGLAHERTSRAGERGRRRGSAQTAATAPGCRRTTSRSRREDDRRPARVALLHVADPRPGGKPRGRKPQLPNLLLHGRPSYPGPSRHRMPSRAATPSNTDSLGGSSASSPLLVRGGQRRTQSRFVVAAKVPPPVDKQGRGAAGAAFQGAVGVGLDPLLHPRAV